MKNYRVVIHIKNHNLCISIILILFFLLGINISHIYNEESNVYLKIADSLNRAYPGGGALPPRGSRGTPPPTPLPKARGEINHV